MKKKLLTLTAVLCLICTMIPLGTDTASAYGGEPGDVKPTVTLNKRSCEFYTSEYDTYTGWTLDIYGGSDSLVCDVTTEEGSLYDRIMNEHVTITNVPDGTKVSVAFAGKYPAMDSSQLDSKIIKLSYSKTTYNGKAKKPKFTIDGKKQAD